MSATKAATISTIARRSLRAAASPKPLSRCISSASCVRDAALEERPSEASNPPLDSSLASKPANRKPGTRPPLVGSARRRAALRHASGVPFEQLPYQAFQEARKILIEDRQQKLEQILEERKRIAKLQRQDPAAVGGEKVKEHRLREMQQHLEKLKILADINDPVIKKRYEDGEGDMSRPIYRYLADKQWRSYRRNVIVQRMTQMNIVPDLLPALDPTADVRVAFSRRHVQPGDFVESRVSETPPKLRVQVFDKGERLVSVAVVDPDVPDVEHDRYNFRCHFLAANIPLSPTDTSLPFSSATVREQTIMPWLPPWAQKGSPYHRLAIFVLQQEDGKVLDVSALKETLQRDGFNIRSFIDKYQARPIGFNMFRSKWDEGMAGVMTRAGISGADLEFRRPRTGPQKPPQLPLKKKKNLGGLPSKRL